MPAQHLTSIEVNGTFYRTQTPKTFRKWASEVPDGFVFALKGPRYAVNRRVLQRSRRLDQALPRFRHDRARRPARPPALAVRADQEIRRGRLRRLPRTAAGKTSTAARCATSSRCATTASRRRPSSRCCAQVRRRRRLCRARHLYRDRRRHRRFRLCAAAEGRREAEGRLSAEGARCLGQAREDLGRRAASPGSADVSTRRAPKKAPRDVFIYFIHEAKVRAPAAAMALIERLS